MFSFRSSISLALLMATPVLSVAQTGTPLTREEVLTDLRNIESSGYIPPDHFRYPESAQAAESSKAKQSQSTALYAPSASVGTTDCGGSPKRDDRH
jgi:hypothetical protein